MEIQRECITRILELLKEPLPIFQVLVGPRQVGKTTAAKKIIELLGWPHHYAVADEALPPGPEWIETQWRVAAGMLEKTQGPVLLVLDEIQKIQGWSEVVKKLWDAHKSSPRIRLMVLGSSALLLQKGLSESLMGRFFLHRFPHWSYSECKQAFGWNLEEWLYFGGYPGAAPLAKDPELWRAYVKDSLIETTLAKDVMQMQIVAKPALLRQLFALAANYPSQILAYNKMLGQLQDAGNTTTLAHYVKLLESAFLLSGLENFSKGIIRSRASSPKLILWNNALVSAYSPYSFSQAMEDPRWYGRLVENAVGAYLLGHLNSVEWSLHYWRSGPAEVDFVVARGQDIFAIEVKSGAADPRFNFDAFKKLYSKAHCIVIGSGGLDLETFFSMAPQTLLR